MMAVIAFAIPTLTGYPKGGIEKEATDVVTVRAHAANVTVIEFVPPRGLQLFESTRTLEWPHQC